jgi:hypothetical protein
MHITVYGPSSSWRRPLPVSCIWTCSNSSSFHNWRGCPRRTHSLSARRRTPSLPWRIALVPQHPFPRSVYWSRGTDSMAGHLVPRILHPLIFSYGDSLKLRCSYHLYLQISLSSELELLPQLQKWHQRCSVECGKILTTGGTSATLPMEVTSNHNYPR